ncbi:uncharacterized protein LOC131958432 isoform X1 [Physella acuta]|uniref:uncharacterized protein LOC131958432 isoform X1 n=1 Tax=Physella acuta TaxID=109671 RepID=UPI0027DB171D|nr:uncharacterized protein LOC131958432 isoform X1 [Physella acuta]
MRRRLSHNPRVAVGLVFLLLAQLVVGQNNPALTNNDPINSNINANTFYFDSNSDCNGPIRELYGLEATIRGNDLSSQRLGPATCTIVLRSTSQFEGTVLDIEVKAMNILDCTTQVAIYDGDGAQILLMSYDCRSSQNQNQKRFLTSGNTATFIMTRQNVNSYNFDIEIKINPVRAGSDPNYENGYGSSNPFAFYKFPQEGIVGMIGGFYAAIIGICIIVIIYKNRSFQGLNKEWETHQLATLKTGISFDAKSQMTQQSQISTLNGPYNRGPASQYSRGTTQTQPRKPPPPSEDGDSAVYYNDDTFQKRRLMKEENEKSRPRYNQPVEDAPDNFKERVIVSRVKGRSKQPPSYNDALSDSASERSSDEESEATSSNSTVRKRPPSSSEDERSERSSRRSRSTERSSRSSRSPTPSETESEEVSESDGDSRYSNRRHKARKPKPKKPQAKAGPSRKPPQQQQQQPYPRQPVPQMQPMPYGAYPPGQFVPMMAGPPHVQPVPMVPGYPPPRYPVNQRDMAPRGPQVQPTDIPVYSYLVQRGYKPIDLNNSQGSVPESQGSGGGRLEEPDLRLDSGVEYMRR